MGSYPSIFETITRPGPRCATIGELLGAQRAALVPLMDRYRVDVYDAGRASPRAALPFLTENDSKITV